ncbi:MAG: RNA methyltransferase [Planctomycetota bacterium]
MIRIVLCRPGGPRNVGSIVRALANFGPAELVIVGPIKPSLLLHPDFTQMGHGAEAKQSTVRVVDSITEALADMTHAVGFTARRRDHRPLVDWREARDDLVRRDRADERLALVFGSEEAGLLASEAAPCHVLARIPTSDEHGSLNLAMAVAVVASTLFLERGVASAATPLSSPLPGKDRHFLVERLAGVLSSRATTPAAARDIEASVRRLFARAELETRDARAWHLLARALGDETEPSDYGVEALESPKAEREARKAEEGRA